jgi:hypothetical protein
MKNLREEIENKFTDRWFIATQGRNDIRRKLIISFFKQQMKGLVPKKRTTANYNNSHDAILYSDHDYGYNQAIDQILKNIESL